MLALWKGFVLFIFLAILLYYFFGKLQRGRRREIRCSIFSVCLKRKDWKVYTRFYDIIIFFWFVGIFVHHLYIQIFKKLEKYFKDKNSSVYLYDHLIIIAIVLTTTVFMVFNHAKNKKIRWNFSDGKGKCSSFGRWNSEKKGTNCFIHRQSKKTILESNSKIDFIFVTSLELL